MNHQEAANHYLELVEPRAKLLSEQGLVDLAKVHALMALRSEVWRVGELLARRFGDDELGEW